MCAHCAYFFVYVDMPSSLTEVLSPVWGNFHHMVHNTTHTYNHRRCTTLNTQIHKKRYVVSRSTTHLQVSGIKVTSAFRYKDRDAEIESGLEALSLSACMCVCACV